MSVNIEELSKSIEKIRKDAKEIPSKRLADLRKSIAKYEESVNKCDIFATNVLADSIGADIDYLRFSIVKTTDDQKRELENLENQFSGHMDKLTKCRCVKKITK